MSHNDSFLKWHSLAGAILVSMTMVLLLSGGCAPRPRVYRVGILSGLDFFSTTTTGFIEKMANLGYVAGKNIRYDCRKCNFDSQTYKSILAEFIVDRVDLIFVFPTEASLEAREAARESGIPVLFANAITEETGLINSVAEPGGNITGVRWPGPDLAVKILEIMREVAPKARRIWLPFLKGYPTISSQLKVLRSAAAASGIALIESPVSGLSELKKTLDARNGSRDIGIDAIITIPEPLSGTPDAFSVMCDFARQHALPIGGTMTPAEGCESLFGVNVDPVAVGRQAAVLADKILCGVPAGSLHVVSAETCIQINFREIQKRGFNADEGLLSSANAVVR